MSITQIGTEFLNKLNNYFSDSQDILTIARMEQDLTPLVQAAVCEMIGCYLEMTDEQIREDKVGRKKLGYSVERRGDQRRVLTTIGEVRYERTYYAQRCGEYEYLVDAVAGIDSYARISDGVSVAIAGAACEMSYAKSSAYETGGVVSRQTVMNHIRANRAVKPPEQQEKRRVSVLHIDADEDHVTMRGGKKSIVPLISVYEGIEKIGTRGVCTNIFHISEYGKPTEELWEQALSEVEAKYDLSETRIYLHGDGASWIKQGLEWFPRSVLVLDKYHKNKAITAMTAGLDKETRKYFNKKIRRSLDSKDRRSFLEITDSIVAAYPEREEKIRESAGYLNNHIDAIAICAEDPEANNGGCTEPHVSHILSSRLSSRPLAWSAKTLKQFVPMLANGGDIQASKQSPLAQERLLVKAARAVRRKIKKIQFAPHPDAIGTIRPLNTGKVTQLSRTLNSISQVSFS